MDTMTVVDCLLALGLTLRLVRLAVFDDLGKWYLVYPAQRWLVNHERSQGVGGEYRAHEFNGTVVAEPLGWRQRLVAGVDCPWCIGFWIGVAVLASLWLVGGPGDAAEWWRWTAGAFTLNYVAAHLGPRLGDTGHPADD